MCSTALYIQVRNNAFVRNCLTYLLVIAVVAIVAIPGARSDVAIAVGKVADKLFECWIAGRSVESDGIPVLISLNGRLNGVSGLLIHFVPMGIQSLHEFGISFQSGRVARLHDCDVASGTNDVTNIVKVIASKSVLGYLDLFTFMPIVDCDDSSRGTIRSVDLGSPMSWDTDVLIVIPAVYFECLGLTRLIVNRNCVRHDEC